MCISNIVIGIMAILLIVAGVTLYILREMYVKLDKENERLSDELRRWSVCSRDRD